MTAFFLSVYHSFSQHRGRLFTLLALLLVLFLFSAGRIRFKEDISRFLPGNQENERIHNAYQYIASSNTVAIYCRVKTAPSPHDPDTHRPAPAAPADPAPTELSDPSVAAIALQTAAVDALAERLQTRLDTSQIKSLFYRINPAEMLAISSFLIGNMPYFLEEEDYQRLEPLLTREEIARQLAIDKNVLTSSAGMLVRNNFLQDPLQITSGLMRKLQNFKASDQFRLYDDHLFNAENQTLLFVECALPASETKANALFLDSLQSWIAETEKEFGDVTFESFSAAEIGLTNSRQIQKDTMFSMTLAVILILALLIYSFRSGRQILLIFASVLFGGLFALALLHVISGEVSVIAVGISSILFGIAINYPLHFMEHYNRIPDSKTVIKDIIEPLTIGNITTVGAFLSLVFIGSDAMKDLGLFASLLLIGTILFVLFFLPHLLVPGRKRRTSPGLDRLIARPFENNRWLVGSVILLTVFFGFFSGGTQFETNLQKINYMTSRQQKSFEKMMGALNQNQHVLYWVSEGDNLESALIGNEKSAPVLQSLIDDGEIYRASGVGGFLPSQTQQRERLKRWNDFWHPCRDRVQTYIREEAQKIGFSEDAFRSFEELLNRTWEVVDLSHFDLIRETLVKNCLIEKDNRVMVVNRLYTDASKAEALEKKLNRDNPSLIAFDAGSITRRMVSSLSDNFNYVLYICGLIVFAFLIFSLGRLELSLIAFTPLALSWIWILGLMNLFDLRFNIVNIILATFIFGQGDDYTIFMTEGLMYEYAYRRKMLASYKKSIALSAFIMLVGMGMLIFARHPALRSLAETTLVGMFSVVVMAYILPSLLFRLLTVRKGGKRLMPVTGKNLSATVYAFLFFLIMSAVITLIGWFLFTFGRVTEAKKQTYHKLLHRVALFVIYRIPQVKTTFRNLTGETFDKPGVIICNHQAHLDLMCIMMLTPKLIILTNDWVWNSPFYGRMIRYADFYPVSNGVENAIDRLQDAVHRGYSIVVFPEGTRSADCSIQRFHKGAFLLAERLHVDLIPILIHGVGHVLPKEEFMLRKGRIHIRIMPRITPHDARFSRDYSPRSREVRHYYRAEYKKLQQALETPDYYADRVLKNYIYKGAAIERAVRRNLKNHHNYAAEIAAMPAEGEVTLPNTGYGEFALLLALVRKDLKVEVIEPDPDIRALAENCASVPRNLIYR
jgi:1-acyl-sn-glycerol-3-phosphate acyltransferase